MEKRKVKELTKAELQIMQLLWDKESAYVNDLLEEMPEPKPAYNTVSTIVRILEKKGFVSHESHGNTHKYFPVVDKDSYLNSLMHGIVNSFFSGLKPKVNAIFSTDLNRSERGFSSHFKPAHITEGLLIDGNVPIPHNL